MLRCLRALFLILFLVGFELVFSSSSSIDVNEFRLNPASTKEKRLVVGLFYESEQLDASIESQACLLKFVQMIELYGTYLNQFDIQIGIVKFFSFIFPFHSIRTIFCPIKRSTATLLSHFNPTRNVPKIFRTLSVEFFLSSTFFSKIHRLLLYLFH